MSWILVAFIAYLFLAIANLFDKFLVDNVVSSSKAYAFIACLMGGVVILVAPWYLEWPGVYWLIIDLISGGLFATALWLLYEALRRGEASQTLVFVGGLTPVFSISFSILFFKEHFSTSEWLGISALLIGIFIVALLPQQRHFLSRLMNKLKLSQNIKSGSLIFALFSALAYASYFILTKYAYSEQTFISAFIWTRLGAALFVLSFLIRQKDRNKIFKAFQKPGHNKHKFLVVVNQLLGSAGFILQNYAVFLGSVALVNAFQGVQYAFLLIVSTVLAILSPKLLKETFSWKIFLQKLLAVCVIGLGLYFIMV
ncbi:MAG: EamA family transporter [Candidatus Falkowbacteria bacterium]